MFKNQATRIVLMQGGSPTLEGVAVGKKPVPRRRWTPIFNLGAGFGVGVGVTHGVAGRGTRVNQAQPAW